jgi:serine/threonine protein kinase
MSYSGSESLDVVLNVNPPPVWLTDAVKTEIVLGICVGMHFVHSAGIIHCDLSPRNIILDEVSHYPKISGFGMSQPEDLQSTMTKDICSPAYTAPEMIRGENYTKKIDIFSFGVILYEIVTGEKAHDEKLSPLQLGNLIVNGKMPAVPDSVGFCVSRIIKSCWSIDPEQRPDFHQIFSELQKSQFQVFSYVSSCDIEEFLRALK